MNDFIKRALEYHPLANINIEISDSMTILFEQKSTIGDGLAVCRWYEVEYMLCKKQDTTDRHKLKPYIEWAELLRDFLELGYDKDYNLRHVMKVVYPDIKYSL